MAAASWWKTGSAGEDASATDTTTSATAKPLGHWKRKYPTMPTVFTSTRRLPGEKNILPPSTTVSYTHLGDVVESVNGIPLDSKGLIRDPALGPVSANLAVALSKLGYSCLLYTSFFSPGTLRVLVKTVGIVGYFLFQFPSGFAVADVVVSVAEASSPACLLYTSWRRSGDVPINPSGILRGAPSPSPGRKPRNPA